MAVTTGATIHGEIETFTVNQIINDGRTVVLKDTEDNLWSVPEHNIGTDDKGRLVIGEQVYDHPIM